MKKFFSLFLVLAGLVGVALFNQPPVNLIGATGTPPPPVIDGCEHNCPVVHFEWDSSEVDVAGHYTCPSGKHLGTGSHADDCYYNGSNNYYGHANWVSTTYKIVHHSADVAYEKSNDPNKCHRPSDNDLEDVYGMDQDARSDFKDDGAPGDFQTLDAIDVVPDGYYHSEGACYPKTPVCTDQEATNYGGDDHEFDETREVSNDELCQYSQGDDGTPAPSPTPTPTPAVGGTSDISSAGPQQCTAQKPSTPGLLNLDRIDATSVRLNWTPADPVTYYSISYGTDPNNFQYGVPNVGNVTTYVIGALNPNSTYYFSVRGVNDCNPSDPSNVLPPVGQVLGASTKVLGASTLGSTGSTEENLFLGVFTLGAIFLGMGVRKHAARALKRA